MILLKANNEIKKVFLQMIKTMGENLNWTEIFLINNNDIILAGKGRSLFFNFENKRTSSNIVELPIQENQVEQIIQNMLLENTLNMILYAFGKWGGIKGLKVEKNYDQLNGLINSILEEINIKAVLSNENFRFFKVEEQITYEEVIKEILEKSKPEVEVEEEEKDELENKQGEAKGYGIGLWHNIRWTGGAFAFKKAELTESDRAKSRLGNDFYMVAYICPHCGEKLYMVVYPMGKEFRIETDEEALYMARAYTCSSCIRFYTPKPNKLIMDGDVYYLSFEDDKEAYEDYLELLGRQGERTSNCNFNQFESEYNKKTQEVPPKLEAICSGIDTMSENDIEELRDKMDSGFYPQISVDTYKEQVVEALKISKDKSSKDKSNKDKSNKDKSNKDKINKDKSNKDKRSKDKSNKYESNKDKSNKDDKNQEISKEELHTKVNIGRSKVNQTSINIEQSQQNKKESEKSYKMKINLAEIDLVLKALDNFSAKQLQELKEQIQKEPGINVENQTKYIDRIDNLLNKEKEMAHMRKGILGHEKTYAEILQVMDEIKIDEGAEYFKNTILKSLMELLNKRGAIELESIVSHIPQNISRSQYNQLSEKMEQYKEMDHRSYKRELEDKRDVVEKQEIAAIIKRVNTKDRYSLLEAYQNLKGKKFENRNVDSFLEKIQEKLYAIDEAAIKRICSDPADISFDEGLQMYEKIAEGDFLPELKSNVLDLIDKRLKKIKMDECEQLVRKLSRDTQSLQEDNERIHFYEVRKMMRGDMDAKESIIVNQALNAYASSRGKYEYPILICDSSLFANGEEGFVLTPDHIFYSSLLNTDLMNVLDVEHMTSNTGLFSKGIYVNSIRMGKVKISNSLKMKEEDLKSFGIKLDEFVDYLKEKPESRNISYLKKEEHAVKCCYRCGNVYKEGDVCPKCGSKNNV